MSIYRGRTTREVYLANLLYDAIDDEDINSINTFLLKGADCNIVLPKKGISPFHLVVGKESSEETATNFTILFLQNGADPNVRSDDGLTPLHISAAYGRAKIVRALLCCGGNPDLRDSNYKKPIDYAHEYEHKDCLDLLLSFMERPNLFSRREITPAFNLTLEKIVVENGGSSGDYEIVQEYKTEPLTQKNLESLHQLPESDSVEYVMKWCQNHLQIPEVPLSTTNTTESPGNSSSTFDFFESSFDESEGGKSIVHVPKDDKITFRKKYRKVRKVNSTQRKSKVPNADCNKNNAANETVALNASKDYSNLAVFSNLKEFSHESGIMTLPCSKNESYEVVVKEDSISAEPIVNIPLQQAVNNNTSTNTSDFRTCSSCNDTAGHYTTEILNRNIFEMTSDISRLKMDESRSRKSSAKSDAPCGSEISFVSVSEVYKYIDEDEDVVLYEKRLLKAATSDYSGSVVSSSKSSKMSSLPATVDYDTDTLRKELTNHGYNPGPITLTTKRIYLRKLKQLKSHPQEPIVSNTKERIYSVELEKTLRDPNWERDAALYKSLEEVLVKDFANPNPTRKWREGVNKTSFTYLLMDPRITNNLPCRAEMMETKEIWEVFLSSIFYVGKGKRSRPYSHLYDAVNLWKEGKKNSTNKKLNKILNIWNENCGVICLHIFQNVIPVEAYTREAAIISALKIENLKNIKGGEFYGTVSTWTQRQKKMLGVYLLHKAMMIFINEGERQLCPKDI
ncbi:hypothetical protein WA026_007669 [Henosepilachna vigintioctopunctata]|uniref:LEM domain-containing protein n=1 Tax=Henosepilachna vigintioctopunctata TaxID=420089 RepID=A0AAW1U2T3_9CUCU